MRPDTLDGLVQHRIEIVSRMREPTNFQLELTVERDSIDSLGHVNNAAYVRYFERGRIDLYRRIGLRLGHAHVPRLGTVVVNININFRRECFLGDRLRLTTSALRRGRRSFVIGHLLERHDGEVAADGETTCVVMDLDERAVVALPAELAAALPPAETAPETTDEPG